MGIAFVKGDDASRRFLSRYARDRAMPWLHVANGEMHNEGVAAPYRIHGVPTTVLLGRDGRVIGVDLRGKQLEDAIEKALAIPTGAR